MAWKVNKKVIICNIRTQRLFPFRCSCRELNPLTTASPAIDSNLKAMDIRQVQAQKTDRLNVKHFLKDKENCWITSLAATDDNRVFMMDFYNKKIKVLGGSRLSIVNFVPASSELRDITVINDKEAVAALGCEQKLQILDITENSPSVKETIKLDFDAMCVAVCEGGFVVTCPNTNIPSVKKVDRSGKVIWSVSGDRFPEPWYICSNADGSKFYMGGRESHLIVMVDSATGNTERSLKLEGKHPRGLCTDKDGALYVCYQNGIGILTSDLSEEKVLLSEHDGIDGLPEAICYDANHDRLFISYSPLQKNCNSVDIVQLIR